MLVSAYCPQPNENIDQNVANSHVKVILEQKTRQKSSSPFLLLSFLFVIIFIQAFLRNCYTSVDICIANKSTGAAM